MKNKIASKNPADITDNVDSKPTATADSALNNRYLDVSAAAKFLCVKPSTLYTWVHYRRVPFRKHGTRLVFHAEALIEWSEKNSFPSLSN